MVKIQSCAVRNNSKVFFASMREVYNPQGAYLDPVKNIDCSVLHREKPKIMERWREHFNLLLNSETSVKDGVSSSIPQLPIRYHMDELPTAEEFDMAIKRRMYGKATGPDDIPLEG